MVWQRLKASIFYFKGWRACLLCQICFFFWIPRAQHIPEGFWPRFSNGWASLWMWLHLGQLPKALMGKQAAGQNGRCHLHFRRWQGRALMLLQWGWEMWGEYKNLGLAPDTSCLCLPVAAGTFPGLIVGALVVDWLITTLCVRPPPSTAPEWLVLTPHNSVAHPKPRDSALPSGQP